MNKFRAIIDSQIESSSGKNLFIDSLSEAFLFTRETIDAISLVNKIDYEAEEMLIDYSAEKAFKEFCRVNQYYSFSKQDKLNLRDIYSDLFTSLKNNPLDEKLISANHFQSLRKWLKDTNPSAEKLYSPVSEYTKPVVCEEYSHELQVEVLNIDIDNLMEPVLDIGCGAGGNLVNYLRKKGIDAYGFDRFSSDNQYIFSDDWLEFPFGIKKWGTIISHLGYSNHFRHHHLRNDGDFIEYGKKYIEILNSLKPGGSFHYAPGLPFIEEFLDSSMFHAREHYFGDYDFHTVIIKRTR